MSDLLDRDAAIRALEALYLNELSISSDYRRVFNAAITGAINALKALPLAAPATESQSPLMNDEARLEGRQGKPDAAVPQVPLRETPPVSAATPAPCKALSGGTCDCFDPAAPVAPTAPRWTADQVHEQISAELSSDKLGLLPMTAKMLHEFAARLDAEVQQKGGAILHCSACGHDLGNVLLPMPCPQCHVRYRIIAVAAPPPDDRQA